jgi:hypothetical protein
VSPKQTIKKSIVDSRSDFQTERNLNELPLFLREDYIFRERPKFESKQSEKDINPLVPITEKLNHRKQELEDIEKKLELKEYEN